MIAPMIAFISSLITFSLRGGLAPSLRLVPLVDTEAVLVFELLELNIPFPADELASMCKVQILLLYTIRQFSL